MKSVKRSEISESSEYGGHDVNKKTSGAIRERDEAIQELKETIEIMEMKIKKLEQLVKLKDSKIQTLANKLAQYEEKSI